MMQSILPASARNAPPQSITQQELHDYFALRPIVSFPAWTILLFVFGLCSFFAMLGNLQSGGAAFSLFIVTAILVGIGASGIYFAYAPTRAYDSRSTITDSAFDGWVEWQRQRSLETGCRRLNIDYSQLGSRQQVIRDPICIQGFRRAPRIVPTTGTGQRFVIGEYRTGADNITRWRHNMFIWFLPQDHQLAAYTYGIDAVLQQLTEDKTQEFFYQAVSGISTSQDRLEGLGTGHGVVAISATSFSLSIDSGEKMTMPVTPLEAHLRVRDTGLEQAINSLRELLRNKKQQMLPGGYAPGYPPSGGYPPAGGYPSGGYPPAGGYPSGGYAPPGYAPSGPQGAPPTYPPTYPPSGGYTPAYPTNAPTVPGANSATPPPPYPGVANPESTPIRTWNPSGSSATNPPTTPDTAGGA